MEQPRLAQSLGMSDLCRLRTRWIEEVSYRVAGPPKRHMRLLSLKATHNTISDWLYFRGKSGHSCNSLVNLKAVLFDNHKAEKKIREIQRPKGSFISKSSEDKHKEDILVRSKLRILSAESYRRFTYEKT